MPPFEQTNVVGMDAERRVAEVMLSAGWWVQSRSAMHKRDLAALTPAGVELIEVKNEDRWPDSPNLCIEMHQGLRQQRFSGISISEATVCVHTYGEMCVAYRRAQMWLHLLHHVHDGIYKLKMFAKSDNGNEGVLVPKRDVIDLKWAEQLPLARLAASRVFKV